MLNYYESLLDRMYAQHETPGNPTYEPNTTSLEDIVFGPDSPTEPIIVVNFDDDLIPEEVS